ncbi:MAG: lipoyl protein ligase domain-containing protein, partial [Candidatus Poseidoniaceae archaeon]
KWDLPGESSVAKIIALIEQWVINSLANFGINCHRDERMQGVWLDGYKICSIGLSFLRWTSRHGFTINLNTPGNRVENLAGCGLESSTTTCLLRLGHELARDKVIDSLIDNMPQILNRNLV